MYGSKVVCCSPGRDLVAASLSASDYSFLNLSAVVSPGARYLCSVASNASPSSRSTCVRPCNSYQLSLHRRPVLANRKKPSQRSAPPSLSIRSFQPQHKKLRLLTCSQNIPTSSYPLEGGQFFSSTRFCKVLNADANPEVEVDEDELSAEVNGWTKNDKTSDSVHAEQQQHQEQQQQRKTLKNRIVFGVGLGALFLGVVLAGGWFFTLAFSWVIWFATGEYFELVKSKSNVASGMTPPPPLAAKVCAAICSLMPIMTLYYGGRMGVVVTTSAFGLATVLLLHKVPRFSQMTSAFFGLIYCGYLPSFWIKLRCGLTVPALNTRVALGWPILFGGQAHWTVGLVATIVSCSAIAAADTFSFLGGKTFGKTPLIAISPKKTLEGAAVGLSCTIAVTILLSKLLQWPSSTPSAAVLAVLVFMSSLFGDLTESMIKRDAGVKDSGQVIPGHGGILDRVDSYIFTGALVYSFVKIGLPLFGV